MRFFKWETLCGNKLGATHGAFMSGSNNYIHKRRISPTKTPRNVPIA